MNGEGGRLRAKVVVEKDLRKGLEFDPPGEGGTTEKEVRDGRWSLHRDTLLLSTLRG